MKSILNMKAVLLASYELLLRRVFYFSMYIEKLCFFVQVHGYIHQRVFSSKVPRCYRMMSLQKICSGFCNFFARATMEVRL